MADKKDKELKETTEKATDKKTVTKKTADKKPASKKVDAVKKENKAVDTKKKETKVVKEVKKDSKDSNDSNKEAKETKKDKAVTDKKVIEAKAFLRYERIAPSKVNVVAKLIRGKNIDEALDILRFTNRAASTCLAKLVNSAIANAVNNHSMDKNKLYVSHIQVNAGPTLKRMRAGSRGSGYRINKRSSHVVVVLMERE